LALRDPTRTHRGLVQSRIHLDPCYLSRLWYGYTAYNPDRLLTLLDIYRTYYNYCALGGDKRTPAMPPFLAKGPVRREDILYFRPTV
jgi:hypothetical protein